MSSHSSNQILITYRFLQPRWPHGNIYFKLCCLKYRGLSKVSRILRTWLILFQALIQINCPLKNNWTNVGYQVPHFPLTVGQPCQARCAHSHNPSSEVRVEDCWELQVSLGFNYKVRPCPSIPQNKSRKEVRKREGKRERKLSVSAVSMPEGQKLSLRAKNIGEA